MPNHIRRAWLSTENFISRHSTAWIAFFSSCSLLTAGAIVYGYRISLDTAWFVENGVQLIDWLQNPQVELLDHDRLLKMKAYIIPSLFLGGAHLLPFGLSISFVLGVQILMFSSVVFICFRIWQSTGNQPQYRILWLAGGLFITFGLVDVPLWTYWLLTDITFLFWTTLFVYTLVLAVTGRSRIQWLTSLALAILAMIVRPPGICLPFVWIATLLFWMIHRRTGKTLLPFLLVLLIPIILVVFFVPWLCLVQKGGQLPLWFEESIVSQNIAEVGHLLSTGIIMADRPGGTFESPTGYSDYVLIVLLRLYYHYVPFRQGHSIVHHVANAIYFPTALILAIYGLRQLLHRGRRCINTAAVIIIVAVYFGLLHGVTILAFSWRYQVPATLSLWLSAGFGLKFVMESFQQRFPLPASGAR